MIIKRRGVIRISWDRIKEDKVLKANAWLVFTEKCPACGNDGLGFQWFMANNGEIRKYFGHKLYRRGEGWTIRWCYLGKENSLLNTAMNPTLRIGSADSPVLGNKLGNIGTAKLPDKTNTGLSGQIAIEISPNASFGKAFQFTGSEYKRFVAGPVGFDIENRTKGIYDRVHSGRQLP